MIRIPRLPARRFNCQFRHYLPDPWASRLSMLRHRLRSIRQEQADFVTGQQRKL
jgi:hypothetical protein